MVFNLIWFLAYPIHQVSNWKKYAYIAAIALLIWENVVSIFIVIDTKNVQCDPRVLTLTVHIKPFFIFRQWTYHRYQVVTSKNPSLNLTVCNMWFMYLYDITFVS